jgi:hypothetical protein
MTQSHGRGMNERSLASRTVRAQYALAWRFQWPVQQGAFDALTKPAGTFRTLTRKLAPLSEAEGMREEVTPVRELRDD